MNSKKWHSSWAGKLLRARATSLLLGLGGIIITTMALFFLYQRPDFFEPDRLYHLALLRKMIGSSSFALFQWEQLPLLGWDQYFSNKEFLFHALLYFPMKLGGEFAVAITVLFFSALIIWLPYLLFPRNKFFALSLAISVMVLHPSVLQRFTLLRPHILAVFLFVCLILAMRKKSPYPAAAFSALFCLAYHAFYLPILLAATALFLAFLSRRKRLPLFEDRNSRLGNAALASLGGTAVGLLINPYFPSNIIRGLQHFTIALQSKALQEKFHFRFGSEIEAIPLPAFLWEFGAPAVAIAFTWVWLGWQSRSKKRVSLWLAVLLTFTSILWLGTILSPRTLEFAVALTVLTLYFGWRAAPALLRFSLIAVILLPQAIPLYFAAKNLASPGQYHTPPPSLVDEALVNLPNELSVRVFHSNWGLGPYLLYAKPNVSIIDALDPTFLLLASPEKAIALPILEAGRIPDPVKTIKETFGANYALTERTPLTLQLLKNKNAKLVGKSQTEDFYLFELLK